MTLKEKVLKLAGALEERRSDIAQILIDIAEGGELRLDDIESRYITAPVPAGAHTVQYDTLTTLLAFCTGENDWKYTYKETYTND